MQKPLFLEALTPILNHYPSYAECHVQQTGESSLMDSGYWLGTLVV